MTAYRLSSSLSPITQPEVNPYPCRTYVMSGALPTNTTSLFYSTLPVLPKMPISLRHAKKATRIKSIKEITKEMFALADGMTMSAKKDGIVNMGGFIATRRQDWYEGAKGFCVQFEGYLTYGGMNGRDMNALAIGLDENTEFDNLETRIRQVEYLARKLDEYKIPYQRPAGGHAIFVDAPKVLTHVPKEEFPAQTLTIELYLEAGIRGCEIGYLLADRDPVTRKTVSTDWIYSALPFHAACIRITI